MLVQLLHEGVGVEFFDIPYSRALPKALEVHHGTNHGGYTGGVAHALHTGFFVSCAVRTVVVVSNTPIEQVERIWLDGHSRTSVQLCGYLAANRWKIAPQWLAMDDYSIMESPEQGDAFLIIGDKCFDYEGRFTYTYDLATEWIEQTRLPFVFAVWVARKGLSYDVHDALERALTYGVEHIYEAILESDYATKDYAYSYLTQNIDYLFDTQKHKALKKFWDFGLKVEPKVNPG